MKIAIVGSGALGLYYGAMLARGGNDVCFLLRSDYDAIMAQGLTVRSAAGDFHLTLKGYRQPAEIGTVDLVIIG
ncbi:MAG TPA: 2-dehydropantoate 2-reductase N-terminal domain-containing protein, partial [Geobacterales bacterium]|nr:2-dehydropantoate 2-reductase N-terminal domain-containing protein [Geobacterales bacterium]